MKELYKEHRSVAKDTLWYFLYMVGKQLFILGIFFISARLLNPYDFGLYNYVIAILALLILLGDFGVSTSTAKYIAEHKETQPENLKHVQGSVTLLTCITIFPILLLLILFGSYIFKEKFQYILHLIPSLIFFPLSYVYVGIYRGLKQFKKLSIITTIIGLASLTLSVPLIYYGGIVGALWANNVFSIFFFYTVFKNQSRTWSMTLHVSTMKSIAQYSTILGIVSLSYFVYSRVDIILLGHFGYISEIGLYEVINKVFLILVTPFTIFAYTISPNITTLFFSEKRREVFLKFKQYIGIACVISVCVAACTYISTPFIMKYFFPWYYYSETFIAVMGIMLFMLITQSIAAVVSIGFSVATGHAKINMYFLIFFGIINIPIMYYLIDTFGFIGGVYGTVVIRCVTDVLFIGYYYTVLKKIYVKN